MKPDWDKLMEEFKDSKTAVVADVDCTAEGESLCTKIGVSGYPTIKHGDPNDLKDYEGGRSFDDLKEFADSNLGPSCGPNNLDLCSAEKKEEINAIQGKSVEELDAAIAAAEKEQEDAETTFKTAVEKLQEQYEKLQKKKDDTLKKVKDSGLGLMKSVRASKGGGDEKGEEL